MSKKIPYGYHLVDDDDINFVIKSLKKYSEKIQCIVGKNIVENSVEFGNTQRPSLDDFADKINTLDFLLKLS